MQLLQMRNRPPVTEKRMASVVHLPALENRLKQVQMIALSDITAGFLDDEKVVVGTLLEQQT
ncbi:MAG: hypothetical protein R3242_06130, partial [Akkermansiaceae bacterium]|nr:hypothetical protein [Akkermansiaceae bacterium]